MEKIAIFKQAWPSGQKSKKIEPPKNPVPMKLLLIFIACLFTVSAQSQALNPLDLVTLNLLAEKNSRVLINHYLLTVSGYSGEFTHTEDIDSVSQDNTIYTHRIFVNGSQKITATCIRNTAANKLDGYVTYMLYSETLLNEFEKQMVKFKMQFIPDTSGKKQSPKIWLWKFNSQAFDIDSDFYMATIMIYISEESNGYKVMALNP